MSRKACLSILMVIGLALPALAQQITVTGTVSDSAGEPLIGASVMAQGSTTGTATDFDGNYSITVNPDATLVFSYVGMDPQTIAVDGRTHINVSLNENALVLKEVVAIGYGAVKKSDATGSISVIKPDDIEAGIATSTQDLLVGASPGVVVTLDGGNPTGGGTIRIRGGSSLSASNDPLIVIDGVPQTNQSNGGGMSALTMINPSNIESMTILKDASATAIYGSRASNGVIIVTTKKGQSGRPQVNFAANFSINTARKMLHMMGRTQFVNAITEHLGETGAAQLGYDGVMYDTEWQKEVLRTTFSHDYNLSVGGALNWLPYRISASYTGNNGIMRTSSMDRATANINLSPKFFNGLLSVNANVSGTYAYTGNADTGAIGAAIAQDPTKPVYANIPVAGNTGLNLYNGYYNLLAGGSFERNATQNAVQMIDDKNSHNKTLSSSGNIQFDYALHFLPELHFNLNLGYQVSRNDATNEVAANSLFSWLNDGLLANEAAGAATVEKWHEIQQNTLLDFYINYKKEFEKIKSNLDVMVGYSWQKFNYFGRSQNYVNSLGYVKADGTPGFDYSDGIYFMNQSTVNAIGQVVNNAAMNEWGAPLQLISFFGRLNYIFDDTYLVTFTLRDDASSRFSKDTRWGLFPSVALGWKISNLPVFKDSNVLNEWKLRLGWGQTGQQDIGSYFPYMPVYTLSTNGSYLYPGYNGGWINPLYPNAYDEKIKWETTTTWNVGFDWSFLNNRINASLDWYLRDTDDLLAKVPVKGMNTSDYATTNIGSLRNYGLEFNITARPVVTKDFTWTTTYNVAWNRNKITSLNEGKPMPADNRGVPGKIGLDLQYFIQGEAAFTFRPFQQVYDADGFPVEGQFVDQNADGKIDDEDRINFHSPEPKVTMTWGNTFNYKNWDFGFNLRASIGNWVYNGPRRDRTNFGTASLYGLHNLLVDDYYFTRDDANLPLSDYFIENASFVRCENITVGYTFEKLFHSDLRLRLFGACQNPFVITKYKGIDPEVFDGRDNNVYPRPITFTLGLIATF